MIETSDMKFHFEFSSGIIYLLHLHLFIPPIEIYNNTQDVPLNFNFMIYCTIKRNLYNYKIFREKAVKNTRCTFVNREYVHMFRRYYISTRWNIYSGLDET